jgi:hypothetical protein
MEPPDAKTRYERNSILDWSGRFLLAGLLLEIVMLFGFSKGKSLLEITLEALAYVMVFGGTIDIHGAPGLKSSQPPVNNERRTHPPETRRPLAKYAADW